LPPASAKISYALQPHKATIVLPAFARSFLLTGNGKVVETIRRKPDGSTLSFGEVRGEAEAASAKSQNHTKSAIQKKEHKTHPPKTG
jgi:hypothetical protein